MTDNNCGTNGLFEDAKCRWKERVAELLERAPNKIGKLTLETSAQHQKRAIAQEYAILAIEPGVELLYEIEVDDSRPVNTQELSGIESGFDAADPFSKQVRLLSKVEPHIFAFCLDPINSRCSNKKDAAARLDDEAVDMVCLCLEFVQQREGAPFELAALVDPESFLRSFHSDLEPASVKRLDQVVQRVDFKRFDGITIVGGNENYQREAGAIERFQNLKAIYFGHLSIEKNEIGTLGIDSRNSFPAI